MNGEVREIFKTRANVISYIRRFLDNLDFLEVTIRINLATPHSVSAGNLVLSACVLEGATFVYLGCVLALVERGYVRIVIPLGIT